ncbi:DUF2889 domain-containing protein [bacterium]|nr:DUF2889 domain-containing protein [bacterium]
MITFNRSQLIGAEFVEEDIIRFNGIQEDHIYGMEVQMDVSIKKGRIIKVSGNMKRYTNDVCPQAVPVLQTAVGLSLREEGWDTSVMREIGRKGCEHFAEIIIECGRCFDQALKSRDLWEAVCQNPTLNQQEFLDQWGEAK